MIAVYARVSTEDQAKHGYSIGNQLEKCREKAGTNSVAEYVDPGITGETLNRPALMRMLKDVERGIITKVICYDQDRLSRKDSHQLFLKSKIVENGTILSFVKGDMTITSKNDRTNNLFYGMKSVISEYEKATIRERTMDGRKNKAKDGKVIRDYDIYGYEYNNQTEQLVINEQEADIVKLIFNLFTSPNSFTKGINGIAKYLTTQGIPTKRGAKQWHRQVVRQILMNPTYIGELYQNKWNTEGVLLNQFALEGEKKVSVTLRPQDEWIKNDCPKIIEEDQFKYAQKLLETSRRRYAGKPKNDYFLSGLLKCGECGNTLTGRKAKNWGKYVMEYTDRKNTAGAKHPGCGLTIKCEDIDEQVWNTIENWLQSPAEISATMEADEPALSFEEAELQRVVKEIEKAEKKIPYYLNKIAEGEIDGKDMKYENDELDKAKDLVAEMKKERARLEDVLSKEKEALLSGDILQGAVEYYLSNKEELTREHKKELVRMIVKEIRIYKDERVDIFTY